MNTKTDLKNKDDTIWLACGENCMPIDVLRRHKKDAPSTPFSTGRSDVEHLEYFERIKYSNFLNEDYLIKAHAFSDECYLNISKKSSGTCKPGRHSYFEFTHHNPVISEEREKLRRRAARMLDARKNQNNQVFFYHHRSTKGFEQTRGLIKQNFIKILSNYPSQTKAYCYSQKIVKIPNERGLQVTSTHNKRIIFFTYKTIHPWGGNN